MIRRMTPMERELEAALMERYRLWKQIGYTAVYFKRMLTPTDRIHKGPVGTVRHLLAKNPSEKSGFNRLKGAGKLEWTVEALFDADQPWHALFTESEIDTARQRYRGARTA
jgi:hypothetical protein